MEKCKTKFVPKVMKEIEEKMDISSKKFIKKIKSDLKKVGDDEKQKKSLEWQLNFFTKTNKPFTKKEKESFINTYCNPDCLGTTFQEDADYEKLTDDYCRRIKCSNKQSMLKTLKKNRKDLQKGHKTLLENSFYHGIPKTKRAKMIKDGALSGCILK
jgi:hypothetical protein